MGDASVQQRCRIVHKEKAGPTFAGPANFNLLDAVPVRGIPDFGIPGVEHNTAEAGGMSRNPATIDQRYDGHRVLGDHVVELLGDFGALGDLAGLAEFGNQFIIGRDRRTG